MTVIAIITVGAVGFVLGMYVSSQIEKTINKNINKRYPNNKHSHMKKKQLIAIFFNTK